MENATKTRDLSDMEIAVIVEQIGKELKKGEMSRSEFRGELFAVLSGEPQVLTRKGTVPTEGRVGFGRRTEGQEGTAIYAPEGVLSDPNQ